MILIIAEHLTGVSQTSVRVCALLGARAAFGFLWGCVCGLAGVHEVNVFVTASLCWTCAQCPAPPQLCHRGPARLQKPGRWRAMQQEIQDSLVYEYSV